MHAYISEAVRIMMRYGTSHRSFVPLLWAGLRDWQTSSAWTRGKVSQSDPTGFCARRRRANGRSDIKLGAASC